MQLTEWKQDLGRNWKLLAGLLALIVLAQVAIAIPLECYTSVILMWVVLGIGTAALATFLVFRCRLQPRGRRCSRRNRASEVRHVPDYQDFPI